MDPRKVFRERMGSYLTKNHGRREADKISLMPSFACFLDFYNTESRSEFYERVSIDIETKESKTKAQQTLDERARKLRSKEAKIRFKERLEEREEEKK